MGKQKKNKPIKHQHQNHFPAGQDLPHIKLFQQALTLQMSGDMIKALGFYDQVLAAKPDFADAHFNRGMVLRNLGRLPEAMACYDRVIALDPDSAEAHYNRGNILQMSGRCEEALPCYDRAVSIHPGYAEAHNNRGLALRKMERYEEALSAFDRALAIKPAYVTAHNNRGTVLEKTGRFDEAVTSYNRAIALNPNYPEAYNNLGIALKTMGKPADALTCFDRAIALHPDYLEAHINRGAALLELDRNAEALTAYDRAASIAPSSAEAHNGRGIALRNSGKYEEAVAAYDRAVALNPLYAEAYNSRGIGLRNLGNYEEAIASYDRAIALNPAFAEAYNNRGIALRNVGRCEEALASYNQAIALNPLYAEAHSNRGIVLQDLRRYEEALASFDRACEINPLYAEAYSNRGIALQDLKRFDEALTAYDQANAVNPVFVESQWNKSLLLLLQGKYKEGWRLYEQRWQRKEYLQYVRHFAQPLWLGDTDVQGKTILLYQEQGLGDTIQMLRYVPLLAAKGAKIVLELPSSLLALAREIQGVTAVSSKVSELQEFDLHCPMMSLPLAFKTTLETIPANVPYLKIPKNKAERWKSRLGEKTRPRIGIVWSGTAQHKNDRNRSIPLSAFLPLLEQDAEFHSLQIEYRQADRDFMALYQDRLRDHAQEIADLGDTAALAQMMDLIITVDTSVAHIAGALAKQVWILLPYIPDFRWLQDRPDSPWYPTAKLFRQPAFNTWDRVMELLSSNLSKALQPDHRIAYPEKQEDPIGHYHRANGLLELKQYGEALAAYDRALAVFPDFPEARNNRGIVLMQLKRNEEALAAFDRALAANPSFAMAHKNRAIILQRMERWEDALAAWNRTLELTPQDAEAHHHRGLILQKMGRYEDALAAWNRAVDIHPAYIEAHNNRGGALKELKRYDEALAAWDRALSMNPDFSIAHVNRGVLFQDLKRFEEALACFDRAAALHPDVADTHNSRGFALLQLGKFSDALSAFDRAIALAAGFVKAHSNRGFVLQEMGRFDEALTAYNRAIALDAAYADAPWNKSLLMLLLGKYEEGWQLYEWRRKVVPAAAREFDKPSWLGNDDLQGRTILLYHEQGFGDTLQMLRYIPLLARMGARIVAEVPRALVALFKAQPHVLKVTAKGEALPDFDCQCPFMSLPLAFKTTLETIPSSTPYLQIPPDKTAFWKERLGEKTRPRIGLVWSGTAQHKNDHNRSLPLSRFCPLLETDAEFHSLQVEYRDADREFLGREGRIQDHSSEIQDFSDTAALIDQMDLVITVDTSAAHLAGALAKPVWILLPYIPDFRWLLDRVDSPWYPTAKLFRQPGHQKWDPVIANLKTFLTEIT